MRIERTGTVEPLTPRVEKFLKQHLNAVSIDEVQSHETTRIDYECFDGKLAIELKTLEGPPSVRTENFINELRSRADFPYVLGRATTKAVFSAMNDAHDLQRSLVSRIGRTIVNHLKKANDQLAAHDANFPNCERTRIVLILNEDHPEYDPETVLYIVSRAITQKRDDGCWRYGNIDVVVFISERHASPVSQHLAMPILIINAPSMGEHSEKDQTLNQFTEEWAHYNRLPLLGISDKVPEFATMEHIPDEMARHEMWRLEYNRTPYMKHLTQEQIFNRFDETVVMMLLMTHIDSPMKVDAKTGQGLAKSAEWMRAFTDVQEEMKGRELLLEKGGMTTERFISAAKRLALPKYIVRFLKKSFTKDRAL